MDRNERIGECDCCQFEPVLIRDYQMGVLTRNETKSLCNLCAGTMAGNAYEYPEQYRGQKETLMAICHVGNAILGKLESLAPNGSAGGNGGR